MAGLGSNGNANQFCYSILTINVVCVVCVLCVLCVVCASMCIENIHCIQNDCFWNTSNVETKSDMTWKWLWLAILIALTT